LALSKQRKVAKSAKKQAPISARSATSVDKYVGLRVRAARLSQDMSQEALADALGITFQQVQKYEKGVNRVAVSRLVQVADVLGKPVTWFTPTSDEPNADETEALEQMARGDIRALLNTFARIDDPEIRKRVVALVRAIAAGEG
jgi:transcriptional regulator with XRE-family HTH domain